MRTIKFRGKNLHNGKWVYGYLSDVDSTPIGKVGIINSKPFSGCEESTMVIAESIGQFTGLCDKNGEEIYEGDIIRRIARISFYGNNKASTHVVKFGEDGIYNGFYLEPQCDAFFVSHNSFIFEVIGNIHDNPELMKGCEL